MRKTFLTLGNAGGWTIIELLIVISIMSIFIVLIGASYETVLARIRASRSRADMDAIAMAGYIDYTNNLGVWDYTPIGPGNPPPPSIMGSGLLRSWPEAPCPGWYFSWENWEVDGFFPYAKIAVTLRDSSNLLVWNYCVNTFGGAAQCNDDPWMGRSVPDDLSAIDARYIWCTE